jgi:LPXTG-site transpeptidase (sortase) family protein
VRSGSTASVARGWILAGGAAALLVLTLVLAGPRAGEGESEPALASVPAWASPVPYDIGRLAPSPSPSPTRDPAAGVPVAVSIPALGIDAGVDPVVLAAGGVLVPPADPARVGWWSGGSLPGSVGGTVVLAGHSVRLGAGVFDDLADLERGDRVDVSTSHGEVSYRVRDVHELSKGDLASLSSELFSRSGTGRLVLVTCTDWSAGDYRGNTVVVAGQ